MKKLMVAIIALTSAIVVKANSVDWAFTETVKTDKLASAVDMSGYTAYLFDTATWTGAESINNETFTLALGSAGITTTAAAAYTRWATGAQTTSTTAAVGTSSFYLVLFDGTNYTANQVEGTVYADGDLSSHTQAQWSIAMSATPLASGDFTAVPEPTSGLLLLVGGALLALRRKQK